MTPTRRQFLAAAAAVPVSSPPPETFRLAVCSETFDGYHFHKACQAAARTGYAGLEVAPFHLGEDPAAIAAAQRREFRAMIRDAGLAFVGTHALLNTPKGLHLTTPDQSLRRKSWDYFHRLIDLTADLGQASVMVLGSGRQRNAVEGAAVAEALARLREGLAAAALAAASRRVTILLEPLAPHLSNVVNRLEEAVAIVREIGSPGLQTIFDTHNTTAETLPHDQLIKEYFPCIRHVHLNEMNGHYPGSGDYPFLPVLRALRRLRYRGWLSVEVFDFKPDGETVARRSSDFIRELERQIPGDHS